jgi:hypothetical protein
MLDKNKSIAIKIGKYLTLWLKFVLARIFFQYFNFYLGQSPACIS